jgi:hypothetical protein
MTLTRTGHCLSSSDPRSLARIDGMRFGSSDVTSVRPYTHQARGLVGAMAFGHAIWYEEVRQRAKKNARLWARADTWLPPRDSRTLQIRDLCTFSTAIPSKIPYAEKGIHTPIPMALSRTFSGYYGRSLRQHFHCMGRPSLSFVRSSGCRTAGVNSFPSWKQIDTTDAIRDAVA